MLELRLSEPAVLAVRPGEQARRYVDVPSSCCCCVLRIVLRRLAAGADPVVLASCGEWPVVGLGLAPGQDVVRAHYVASGAFQRGEPVHELVVHAAEQRQSRHFRDALSALLPPLSSPVPRQAHRLRRRAISLCSRQRERDTVGCRSLQLPADAVRGGVVSELAHSCDALSALPDRILTRFACPSLP